MKLEYKCILGTKEEDASKNHRHMDSTDYEKIPLQRYTSYAHYTDLHSIIRGEEEAEENMYNRHSPWMSTVQT